ncbi:MAG: HIT domain-containing protein [Desulfotomaculaceae bacterium]|nr:HIT domain-containing protein [Desulfotomaculaceae bacterium]
MKQIWAPWRSVYIGGEHDDRCIFCKILESDTDAENLVLFRAEKTFVLMNRYPYTNGHVMVVPKRHVGDLEDLTDEEMLELFKNTQKMIKALRSFNPEGFNVGINMGSIAGAGVPGHVHVHVVPRWGGDTNFMPVFGDVRVISESLEVTYKKLLDALARLS